MLNLVFEQKYNTSLSYIKVYLMTIAETFGGLFIFKIKLIKKGKE